MNEADYRSPRLQKSIYSKKIVIFKFLSNSEKHLFYDMLLTDKLQNKKVRIFNMTNIII